MLTADQKKFTIDGVEYLTRFGVLEEYEISIPSFYHILRMRKMRFMRHPKFGKCVKREWVRDYFETQKNFR